MPSIKRQMKSIDKHGDPSSLALTRQRYVQGFVGVLLVALFVAWFLWPSSKLDAARQIQKELFAKGIEKLTPEQRKEKFEALRAEQEKLSPDDRKELRKEVGQMFEAKRSAEAVAYLKMPPAERRKVIDEKIQREQDIAKKIAANNAKGGANGVAGGQQKANAAPAGGPGAVAANVAPGGNGPGGGPQKGKGPSTPEDRDTRRRDMLLHVSPEARAGMDQMRLDMATRRAQLGLPATPPPRGPGGPGKR